MEPDTHRHVLAARFTCGCVAVTCPHEPEVVYIRATGCTVVHGRGQ